MKLCQFVQASGSGPDQAARGTAALSRVSILAPSKTPVGGFEGSGYESLGRSFVLEYPTMRGEKATTRLQGSDREAFKWAMIAAALAMVITAGVVRFGPERPVTGADHQRLEQTLRGSAQN